MNQVSERGHFAGDKVAILIVSYDSHLELARCLTCIVNQTRPANRVVVVENGARRPDFEEAWSPHGIEFVSLGMNAGFAAGNNHALTLTPECELVALVNPDAFLDPDWLEVMCRAAAANQEAASFASRLVKDGAEHLYDGLGDAYHVSGLVWRIAHGSRVRPVEPQQTEVFSACAAAALYRRSALEAVGRFDERFFCYVEDVDLGFRLRLAGRSCVLVWGARVRHIGSVTTGGQRSDFATYHGHRNIEWVYFKNMPLVLLLLFLPLHILLVIVTVVVLSLQGRGRIALRAKLDAFRGLGSVLRARRRIQAMRRASLIDIAASMDKSIFCRRASPDAE